MYHAACKVEFQPFKRLYSQLTFFNLFIMISAYTIAVWGSKATHHTAGRSKRNTQARGLIALTLCELRSPFFSISTGSSTYPNEVHLGSLAGGRSKAKG